jgi:hypothetical protein
MTNFRNFYYRVKNAFKVGLWAFKNPDTLVEGNFKMLSDLLALIMKVSTENKHMMTHIAYVSPEGVENKIVSIWAGAGIGAEPIARISELIKENHILKDQLDNKNK